LLGDHLAAACKAFWSARRAADPAGG